MDIQTSVLGVKEYEILGAVKAVTRLSIATFESPDVARQLIKDGLLKAAVEKIGGAAGEEPSFVTMLQLTDQGRAALDGADFGVKLEAVNVDVGELSERIRQYAETVGKLQGLKDQRADLLRALEEAHPDIFTSIRDLEQRVKDEEPLLEAEVKRAYGAGVEFGRALNGIQIEDGTEPVISDPAALARWMIDQGKTTLPDVDRKTGEPKLDGLGKPKTIEVLTFKNMHRFVARYRDQITMGDIPALSIVPTTKVAWSVDFPALWAQGITLGPVVAEDPDDNEG